MPALYLGRSADLGDAVPASTELDEDSPEVSVKVTNRTGEEAELYGWLNGELATATVPARSAIVTLNWPATPPGEMRLKLTLVSGDQRDSELHDVVVRPHKYHYGYPTPSASHSHSHSASPSPSHSRSASPSPSMSKSVSPSPSHSRSTSPSPSTSESVSPSPSHSRSPRPSHSMTPTPSPSETLPTTGEGVRSYVLLGGGMLVFGLAVLTLAWLLGRRSRPE